MARLHDKFLRGCYTPLITPFRNGKVDFHKFVGLVEQQVSSGSHGIVVAGTTGEPSSLTVDERGNLCRVAVEAAAGRIPVVAATGSQSLAETLELTARAEQAGADALLVVTPYYIRPPQQGLVEYFVAIGRQTSLPMLLYHIPGRAAVSLAPATVEAIRERLPNLAGIKHAANDLDFVSDLRARLGTEFRIFCGLESLSLPMLAVGATGLMNAVGNLVPARVAALYNEVERGNAAGARQLHDELFELNRAIFLETNPIPLKYMMARIGLLETPEVRLPLIGLAAEQAGELDEVLRRAGLLQKAAAGN